MGNRGSISQTHSTLSNSSRLIPTKAKPYRKAERLALRDLFDGLSLHSQNGKVIDKETFLRFFCNLPGMLGERCFYVFNQSHTGEIDFEEFYNGLACYARGSQEQKIAFIFNMFDLDNDQSICKSELETMLNSFVFAAEKIVTGQDAEPSIVHQDNSTGQSGGGYRALNVLGLEFTENHSALLDQSSQSRYLASNNSHRNNGVHSSAHFNSSLNNIPALGNPPAQARRQSADDRPNPRDDVPYRPRPPSTPPPNQSPLSPSSCPPSAAKSSDPVASPGHFYRASFDFSSDVSSHRINHMVEVAMKIAAKDQGQISHGLSSADLPLSPNTSAAFIASASINQTLHSTPIAKRGTHHVPPSVDREASGNERNHELGLSMYAFAAWIQEFPELIWVLDAAFPPNQDLMTCSAEFSSFNRHDPSSHRQPNQPIERDLSVPLDRLNNNDSRFLSNIVNQLSGSKKHSRQANNHHSLHSNIHGRAFSVTSLISPHQSKDQHGLGDDSYHRNLHQRSGIDIRCQQCGWEVMISHCYQCGKKLPHTSSLSNSASSTGQLTQAVSNPSGSSNPVPSPHSHSQSALPSSSAPGASVPANKSPHNKPPSISCDKCGILFHCGHIGHCVQCGFDLTRTGQKIEPPLVKSLSWQRKAGRAYTMEGHLYKIGKTLRSVVERYYLLRDNFLYTYASQGDIRPTHVLFIEGCFVESIDHSEKNSKLKYGFEIIMNEETHATRCFYAATQAQRTMWMEAIRYHSNLHSIDDYYEIGSELGVGKFSSVHLGVSRSSGKQYAIKVIDKSDIADKEKEALRTEVAVLKLLNHPHIIKCKNVFETRKQMFIVMTLVKGGDLFERLTKRKRYNEGVAQKLMFDLLNVVQYLHLRGIVHHDLKPENIMLTNLHDDSQIMIADFGLSRFMSEASRVRVAAGTLNYAAPEVLQNAGFGREVDLWACGVILYLLISGTLPFDSKHRGEIIEQTIAGRVSFEAPLWKQVTDECKTLIKGLLQVDKQARLTCVQALSHSWFKLKFSADGTSVTTTNSNSAPSSPALQSLMNLAVRSGSDTLPTLGVAQNAMLEPPSPMSHSSGVDIDGDSEDADSALDSLGSISIDAEDERQRQRRRERFINIDELSSDEEDEPSDSLQAFNFATYAKAAAAHVK